MLARIASAAVLGIDAYLVDVETDIANGLPSFATVGLPHGAVKEGRERVNSAIHNAGYFFPLQRITVNLAPADIRKEGSAFDLPIALGILAATGQFDPAALRGYLVLGELGLDGEIRPIRGALSMAVAAEQAGCAGLVVPAANVREAAVVKALDVRGASTLAAVVGHVDGGPPLPRGEVDVDALFASRARDDVDFCEVKGQEHAKRALCILPPMAASVKTGRNPTWCILCESLFHPRTVDPRERSRSSVRDSAPAGYRAHHSHVLRAPVPA